MEQWKLTEDIPSQELGLQVGVEGLPKMIRELELELEDGDEAMSTDCGVRDGLKEEEEGDDRRGKHPMQWKVKMEVQLQKQTEGGEMKGEEEEGE